METERLIDSAEQIARRMFDDIDDVMPEVQMLVGALDYEDRRASALFEPVDGETFRVATGFLNGDHLRVIWHRQSSYAMRPDAEAFALTIALLAITEDSLLRLVDAIPVFAKWRDGLFLR
ncbi:MAG TPA: hypothetical protein VH951_01565 [Dehalococcoidia bacterium]